MTFEPFLWWSRVFVHRGGWRETRWVDALLAGDLQGTDLVLVTLDDIGFNMLVRFEEALTSWPLYHWGNYEIATTAHRALGWWNGNPEWGQIVLELREHCRYLEDVTAAFHNPAPFTYTYTANTPPLCFRWGIIANWVTRSLMRCSSSGGLRAFTASVSWNNTATFTTALVQEDYKMAETPHITPKQYALLQRLAIGPLARDEVNPHEKRWLNDFKWKHGLADTVGHTAKGSVYTLTSAGRAMLRQGPPRDATRTLDKIEGLHPGKTKRMCHLVIDLGLFRLLENCRDACWDVDTDAPAPRISGDMALVHVAEFEAYGRPVCNDRDWGLLQRIVAAAREDRIDVLVLEW